MPVTRNSLNVGFKLPPDYTFSPSGQLMHKEAFKRLHKVIKESEKRDPDRFNMHISNDFFGYGILELIDECMSSIHHFTIKKRWLEAWYALHGLSEFRIMLDEWSNVDDGDRVIATEKAFAAHLVKTIRELDAAGLFNEKKLPELQFALRHMAEWANSMGDTLDCEYAKVLNGYGRKLFGRFTLEELKERKMQLSKPFAEFLKGLTKEEREERGDIYEYIDPDSKTRDEDDEKTDGDDDEDDDSRESNEGVNPQPWWGNANPHDINFKHSSFTFSSTWKNYKEQIATEESRFWKSLHGSYYDLTTWSEKEKRKYKYA